MINVDDGSDVISSNRELIVFCPRFVSKALSTERSQTISLFSQFQELLTIHIPLSETYVLCYQECQILFLTRHVLLIEQFPCGPRVNFVMRQNNEHDRVTKYDRTGKKVPNMSSHFLF